MFGNQEKLIKIIKTKLAYLDKCNSGEKQQ